MCWACAWSRCESLYCIVLYCVVLCCVVLCYVVCGTVVIALDVVAVPQDAVTPRGRASLLRGVVNVRADVVFVRGCKCDRGFLKADEAILQASLDRQLVVLQQLVPFLCNKHTKHKTQTHPHFGKSATDL